MGSSLSRRVPLLVAVLVLLAVAAVPGPAGAWAPVDSADITPGGQTIIDGTQQCTTNFVFTSADGERVFVGMSAHCASQEAATSINGCAASSRPVGTPVAVDGAEHVGELAYSSWRTMQQHGETDPATCLFNDFALIELHPDDHDRVNPTMPFWGGPTGINSGGVGLGGEVFSYGNSSLRQGLTALSPKRGISLGTIPEGWSHPVYTVTPGIPGDSGSGVLDGNGAALGALSTLALLPEPASNGVADLRLALDYLRTHTDLDVRLVEGTEPFDPPLLPIDTEALDLEGLLGTDGLLGNGLLS